jgi:hypothetical protein
LTSSSDLIYTNLNAISVEARRKAVFLSIVVLAAALRIYAISAYPLAGDEYGSLAEAKSVGLNWNSIIYSGLMHFWIRLGSSELWLRLPAAIFGTATVAVLFQIGEKLGGWKTAVVAGLLAATSPFNIYHSQEVRFYTFFMFTTAAFILATVHFVGPRTTWPKRAAVLLTALALFFSHFLGPLAVYVQGGAMLSVGKTKARKRLLLVLLVGLPLAACALLLTPQLHHQVWRLYRAYGNAPGSSEPVMTPVSIINLVKVAFAGFIFTFGYHVYPLRLWFVLVGGAICGVLLVIGTRRLWKETRWGILPFAYLLALVGVYIVLDAAGGRLANGVSPRHVAFVWPMFLLLIAFGITSFKRPTLLILAAAILTLNAFSIRSGWAKDWLYGAAPDYRAAAEYASRFVTKETAIIHDGRSKDEIDFYFPKGALLIYSWPYIEHRDLISQLSYQRLIFVTDDWEPGRRRDSDQLLMSLTKQYSCIEGHVDYPLFEYVLERKSSSERPGFDVRGGTNQVLQPLSNYGLEFQDLALPVSVKVNEAPLMIIGAYGLPDLEGSRELTTPLAHAVNAKRVVLLSNVIDAAGLQSGQTVGEVLVENSGGKVVTFPLRMGSETMSWDQQCGAASNCQTVFRWHKRLAIVGQNRYEGALRDFSAGIHGVAFDLPEPQEVTRLTVRYVASAGHLYLWGIALPNN